MIRRRTRARDHTARHCACYGAKLVPRVVSLLLLILMLGQAAGLSFAGEGACAEGCEDDGQGKDCPPVCPTCTCASRPASTPLDSQPAVVPLPPLMKVVAAVLRERFPTSPDPREIIHVPKLLLA
jgi:hypothetical protein